MMGIYQWGKRKVLTSSRTSPMKTQLAVVGAKSRIGGFALATKREERILEHRSAQMDVTREGSEKNFSNTFVETRNAGHV